MGYMQKNFNIKNTLDPKAEKLRKEGLPLRNAINEAGQPINTVNQKITKKWPI